MSVRNHFLEQHQSAHFPAAPHSGDWLSALPISSCGLRLSNDAVCMVVALHLGCSVCIALTCRCSSLVDSHCIRLR